MIARIRPEIKSEDIYSAFFKTGEEEIYLFEKELKNFFGCQNLIFTFSGRGALYYILKAMKEKRVYVPAYTCWVVVEAAMLAGKEIEFIDIDLKTYEMDIYSLEKKVVPDSIILATHQFGIPCKINEILEIAKRKKARVIEDNAAGFGSTINEKKTGTFGEAGILSFEYSKVLTSGKGGAVVFQNEELYEKVKNMDLKIPHFPLVFSVLGNLNFQKIITSPLVFSKILQTSFIKFFGYTTGYPKYHEKPDKHYLYKYPPALAYVARKNLNRIEFIIERRKEIAERYINALLEFEDLCSFFHIPSNSSVSLMRFPLRIKKFSKTTFAYMIAKEGIDVGFTFSYSCVNDSKFPNALLAANEMINLPLYSTLKEEHVEKVIKAVKKIIKKEG
jgi:dTDP-4-amino-4,6-dideoxygalactose transaminase